jgi:hypothetical protein
LRRTKILILTLIVSVLGLFAGAFDPIAEVLWTNTYDYGYGNDYAQGVAVDSQGNVAVAGYLTAPTNYGTDALAMKYNAAGDTILLNEVIDSGIIGGSGGQQSSEAFYDVCVDSEDNTIFVGMYGLIWPTYPTNCAIYVRKYNSAGAHLWSQMYYTYGWDGAYGVCVDKNDDIYVCGYSFIDWGSTRGAWTILKYDKDGGAPILGPIHHNLLGNEYVQDRAYSLAVDDDGNITAVGVIGISGSPTTERDYDWHVRKYDAAGTFMWEDTYAGPSSLYDFATGVDLDSNGDAIVAGYINTGTDNSDNADYDWLVIKYDKDDGTRLWTKILESAPGRSETANDVIVERNDNVIVSGNKRNAAGVASRALVRLRGINGAIMNANWWNSTTNEGAYKLCLDYGRLAVGGYMNNGVDNDMKFQSLVPPLTHIQLEMPADGATLTDPPTFKWNPDGGETNAYSLEVAFKPGGPWRSTQADLGITIWDNSWTCPGNVWNRIPTGVTTYWRVVGRDTTVTPAVYITSNETWTFVKN